MPDNGKAVTVRNQQAVQATRFNAEEIELIKTTICRGATDTELKFFLRNCEHRALDPFKRQICAIKRWNSKTQKEEMAIQVEIDGLRLLAQRTGRYAGQAGPFWCGADGEWKDIWLDDDTPPVAAKVGVYQTGFAQPTWGVAKYKEFVQKVKDGPNSMWKTMPANQLAKCAEAQALRKLFPDDTAGLEIPEERDNSQVDYIIDAAPPVQRLSPKDAAQLDDAFGADLPAQAKPVEAKVTEPAKAEQGPPEVVPPPYVEPRPVNQQDNIPPDTWLKWDDQVSEAIKLELWDVFKVDQAELWKFDPKTHRPEGSTLLDLRNLWAQLNQKCKTRRVEIDKEIDALANEFQQHFQEAKRMGLEGLPAMKRPCTLEEAKEAVEKIRAAVANPFETAESF